MTAPTLNPPERSLDQRMEALKRANKIRSARAQLKLDLKAGRASIHDLLLAPPEYAETAKVFDLLLAVPKYGRVKVNKILQITRVSPSKTLGGLSERQRKEVASMLRRGDPAKTSSGYTPAGGTDRGSQHMRAYALANQTRLERATLKHRVAAGDLAAADVVLAPPPEAEAMTIANLLMAQHRWGRTRMRRFVATVPVLETKTLGSMTDRQRRVIAAQLRGEATDPWWSW